MRELKIYPDNQAVAEAFAEFFYEWHLDKGKVNVALSGGKTPKGLFNHWAEHYRDKIQWKNIHFFWGDERCVSPNSPDSNYGVTKRLLLDRVPIPEDNIHRIRGEVSPVWESSHYEKEIRQFVPMRDLLPVFDMTILGMGDDGHTASIFPDQIGLAHLPAICAIATHPESGQKRITLTGPVINNSHLVVFLVTGEAKATIVNQIMEKKGDYEKYPAAQIHPITGDIIWFLDRAAAGVLHEQP